MAKVTKRAAVVLAAAVLVACSTTPLTVHDQSYLHRCETFWRWAVWLWIPGLIGVEGHRCKPASTAKEPGATVEAGPSTGRPTVEARPR